mmetsp:Transcript_83346/g.269710  ORF Transcript_83346/g.269710 Transcript_83346/m.269710 type:complete len:504 (+) Transcript_83346:76-1587(+)
MAKGRSAEARRLKDSDADLSDEESFDDSEDIADFDDEGEVDGGRRDRTACSRQRGRIMFGASLALAALLLANPLARKVASLFLNGISVDLEFVDVGEVNGTSNFFPVCIARVAALPLLVSVNVQIRDASLWARLPMGTSEAKIGLLMVPELYIPAFQELRLSLSSEIQVESLENLAAAAEEFILAQSNNWRVKGVVDVRFHLFGFIPVSISDITLDKQFALKGMAGFSQELNPVTVNEIVSAEGLVDSVKMQVSVNLHNPSCVAATIKSEMVFGIKFNGHRFGIAVVTGLHMVPGHNVVPLSFFLTNTGNNNEAIQQFISGYMQATEQPVTVVGSKLSSQDPFLSMLLQTFSVNMNFQPPSTQFIQGITAKVWPEGLKADVEVFNPLPVELTMGNLDLGIYLQEAPDEKIFALNSALSQTHVPGTVLQPNQKSTVSIHLSILGAQIGAIWELQRLIAAAEAGRITVSARGPVTFTVLPSYTLTIPYSVYNLTAHLGWCILCLP